MYSVNGIPLDNATLGWRLMRPTKPLLDLVMERPTVSAPGRHGTIPGLPASLVAPVLTFVVTTPLAGLPALEALWLHGSQLSYTVSQGREVEYEFLSWSHTTYGAGMEMVRLDVTVRLAEVFWRDTAETTTPLTSLDAASVNVDAWPGMNGIVGDAIVRLRGPFEGLQVSSGAGWFTYPAAVASGSYLRFHSDTGRAFVRTTDSWTGGTEVSGSVDFDGPNGYFAITPHFTDPASRYGRVEVTTTSRAAGAAVQLRGKGAYLA